ncbi:TraX family protein [Pseudomonas sp. X10]
MTKLPDTTRRAGLDLLKWIAIVSMIADHLRYLWPRAEALFVVGRLAFPLFCLAIAANVARTRPDAVCTQGNARYLGWLLVFSVISELPYRWLDNGSVTLNVIPTLTLGLLVAWGVHHRTGMAGRVALAAVLVATLASDALMYGVPGVLLPSAFLIAMGRGGLYWLLPGLLAVAGNLTNAWVLENASEPFSVMVLASALCSVPLGAWLLRLDDRHRIWPVGRWGYWFYPLHLAAIKGLSLLA